MKHKGLGYPELNWDYILIRDASLPLDDNPINTEDIGIKIFKSPILHLESLTTCCYMFINCFYFKKKRS